MMTLTVAAELLDELDDIELLDSELLKSELLEEELDEIKNSELWQTGQEVRKLRPQED